MTPLVPFTVLQAALCGVCCWLLADGRLSSYGEWSGAGAAFFAAGGLLWFLAAFASLTPQAGVVGAEPDRDDGDAMPHV